MGKHAQNSGHGSVNFPAAARTFFASRRTSGVTNFSCSGTAEANDTRRAVKKIGLIVNIDERTVTISRPPVVARIDKVDDVNISFGVESAAPSDIGIMGGIDRTTGEAWYLSFMRAKDKKLRRGSMFELVCKSAE